MKKGAIKTEVNLKSPFESLKRVNTSVSWEKNKIYSCIPLAKCDFERNLKYLNKETEDKFSI